MDFVALIFFLALYYLRPQEWVADFSRLHPIQILSVMAIWAMFQKQQIGFKKLLRTPLDWLMLAYFIWTLICGFDPRHTFSGIQSVILFYFVGVTSLTTIPRLKKFLGWWCIFTFIIAVLAVASDYGFDPLGSADISNGPMKGRLILNLSVFDNPNALAHSVVPAIPLFYYMVYWRQSIMKAMLLLLIVPLYCIYLTQSKGAFLCGFATLLATLTFGRSRVWQIIIVVIAMVFGYSALYMLPRMQELRHSKSDPAIQGRIAAFTYGLQLMRTNYFGIGLGNFENTFMRHGPLQKDMIIRIIPARHIPAGEGKTIELNSQRIHVAFWHHFSKATHCAYNQNGAELGYVGLYLFVGIMYCCIRTLLLIKCTDNDEERIRRALFAMVVAYAVSSWMVDFCYRPTFFMFVAAISAFHRHLLRKQDERNGTTEVIAAYDVRPWLRRLRPDALPGLPMPGLPGPVLAGGTPQLGMEMPASGVAPALLRPVPLPTPPAIRGDFSPRPFPIGAPGEAQKKKKSLAIEETLRKQFIWTRLGLMDFLIMWALTYAAILYWQHLIKTM